MKLLVLAPIKGIGHVTKKVYDLQPGEIVDPINPEDWQELIDNRLVRVLSGQVIDFRAAKEGRKKKIVHG